MAKKRMKLAKPGKRLGAACIDGVIPFVLYIIIIIAASSRNSYSYNYNYNNEFSYGYHETTGSPVAAGIAGILLLAYLIVELVFYAKAASIGKKILGLQVVSSIDGSPLGFGRMLYREFIVKQASAVLMLGYIWILVDERHRGWHDKIMDTYVVDNKATAAVAANGPAAPYTQAPPAQGMPAAGHAPQQAAPAAAPQQAAPVPSPQQTAPSPASQQAAPIRPEEEPAVDVDVETAPAPVIPKRPSIRLDIDEPAAAEVKADMSMKKEELLAEAAKLGISVNARATKAEIIEAIEKASK